MTETRPFLPDSARARIGLVIMGTDEGGEVSFKQFLPSEVEVHTTRTGLDTEAYENGTFRPLSGFDAIGQALPPAPRLDLIAFSCTSGSIMTGMDAMKGVFIKTHPGIPCINPAGAALLGLRHLELSAPALLTPYPEIVHDQVRTFLAENGLAPVADRTIEIFEDHLLSYINPRYLIEVGQPLVENAAADCLFISCTAFKIADQLRAMANEIGVPVFSSSQFMAWQALSQLRLPGAEDILKLGFPG